MNFLQPIDGNMILGRGVCAIIVAADDNGTIMFASPEAEKLLRAPYPGAMLGASVDDFVPMPHKEMRLQYNAAPRIRRMGLGKPLSAKRYDGTTFPVEVELSPERDNVTGHVLIRAYLMSMEGRTAILPVGNP